MKHFFIISFLTGVIVFLTGCNKNKQQPAEITEATIDQYWQTGKTLPAEVFKKYPLPEQAVSNDNGINVLIDLAHQCKFVTLWGLPRRLNQMGYRAIGSQASLYSVLDEEGKSRVRVRWDEERKIYPFAWHPNFEYNVIITNQSDPNAQNYMPEEQEALMEFVKQGGGLIIFGNRPKDEETAKNWSLNDLCSRFGASITANKETANTFNSNTTYAAIDCNAEWKAFWKSESGIPVAISRQFGKGHVYIFSSEELLQLNEDSEEIKNQMNELLSSVIKEAAAGKQPVGGEPRYPQAIGGGGGIYPELEKQFDDIVLFYAANQKSELLETVNNDIPKAKELVENWLPSTPTLEPMYLILSSGGGGGWAVNAYKPKENGIISLSPMGIISVFAHELAHTMHGPVNDEGDVAGISPIPNRGEAHAGWFQGKVDAWFQEQLRDKPVKNCNSLFEFDPNGNKLDLVTHYENEELRNEFGKGKDWIKTWWIWQKLDDRYGPTWYPRWKYVQHTRWKDNPKHQLSWDEMVEDMSVAVGEDLFPFMHKAGLSLQKKRLESTSFNGQKIQLNVAPIEVTKAGAVDLNEIGDYKKNM